MLEIIVSGKTIAKRPPTCSGPGSSKPSQTPTQMSAKRRARSRATAFAKPRTEPGKGPEPNSGRQPMPYAVAIMMPNSAQATMRSVAPRPATTADGAIGMERNRSMTPFFASFTKIVAVETKPMATVITNIPGIRNAL